MNGSGNVRVLVIEDDPGMRRFLRNTLQVQEYAVRAVGTGGEGLVLIRQMNPELVILDLGLPDLDGMDLIRQVREFSPVPRAVEPQ